jgi:hypothetical protein
MPDRKNAGSPDSLTKSESIALAESELDKVTGGDAASTTQTVTVNKAKTADKAYQQMDAYIRQ